MGGGGMVREVDRAIGAISTLVVGVGILVVRAAVAEKWDRSDLLLREYLRNDKDGQNRWERYELSDDGKDIYYQKKYGAPKMPLFQHRGSCDCGALKFFILAPKRVEAFDDSNALSCKKGRFPYLLLPTSCFEMVQAANVSMYEPQATSTQHAFCSSCGVHIFHFDHADPDTVAVNLYCVDNDNLEDVKIVFVPRGSKPMFGTPRRYPLAVEKAAYQPLDQAPMREIERDDPEASNIAFQKQLMLWSRLDKQRNGDGPIFDDVSTASTSSQRLSQLTSDDPVSVIDMKEQLAYYLKRHLDEEAPLLDNQTIV